MDEALRAAVRVLTGELNRGEPGRRIRADRVEGDVAEVEQPCVADDDVEADAIITKMSITTPVWTSGKSPGSGSCSSFSL